MAGRIWEYRVRVRNILKISTIILCEAVKSGRENVKILPINVIRNLQNGQFYHRNGPLYAAPIYHSHGLFTSTHHK